MEAIKKRMETLEKNQKRMSSILNKNKKLAQDLAIMRGVLQKHAQNAEIMEEKWLDLSKRGMEQNLVIYGIQEEENARQKENCKEKVVTFLQKKMDLEISASQVWKAHRLGYRKADKVRPMVIKAAYEAKELIMENIGKLKGQKNGKTDLPLFISEQMPEGVVESKKKISARVQHLRSLDEGKPPSERKEIKIVNNKVLINGKVDEPEVKPPQPSDLFTTAEKQAEIDDINSRMVETVSKEIKKSVFTALAVTVSTLTEVNNAYIAVAQRFPAADHIMIGYGLKDQDSGKIKIGNCDDREYGGSINIRKVLSEEKQRDTAIFVVRKFGGVHIGAERFHTIQEMARQALTLLKN